MVKVIVLMISMFSCQIVFAQKSNTKDTLKLDLDFDNRIDTLVFDRDKVILICKLSTQNFKSIENQELDFEESHSDISANGNGFTFRVP